LHVAVEVEAADGRRVHGYAADNLLPKWFDKDPGRSFRDNVKDQLISIRVAHQAYMEAARVPRSVFQIWLDAFAECRSRGPERKLNELTVSFGSSFFERALADAAARLAGADLVALLRQDLLEIRPAAVHRELEMDDLARWARETPPSTLFVRHTVGLLDPITAADVPDDGWLDDGLPQTLEECVATYGLRYFKVKVGGRHDEDLARLRAVAATLDRLVTEPYVVSLDGNEQYKTLDDFARLLKAMGKVSALRRFRKSIAFVEQPLDRAVALDPAVTKALGALGVPVVIDESDGELGSFKAAVKLGYRGVSTKNCKGIIKSFLNRSLVERWKARLKPQAAIFMTAEDLTTLPVLPLQQDLATVRALGITHVERNGHHYVKGLSHCSRRERQQATRLHRDLYLGGEDKARLRIDNGLVRVASLGTPGYGGAFEPDLASMMPLEDWSFESLEAES
jgi:enolase-like protein